MFPFHCTLSRVPLWVIFSLSSRSWTKGNVPALGLRPKLGSLWENVTHDLPLLLIGTKIDNCQNYLVPINTCKRRLSCSSSYMAHWGRTHQTRMKLSASVSLKSHEAMQCHKNCCVDTTRVTRFFSHCRIPRKRTLFESLHMKFLGLVYEWQDDRFSRRAWKNYKFGESTSE